MKNHISLAGLLALATITPAFAEEASAPAECPLAKYVTLSGYVVGTAGYFAPDKAPNNDTLFDSGHNNLDSALLAMDVADENLGIAGRASVIYVPNSDPTGVSNAKLLDAYLSYTVTGTPLKVTGGKFLSYFGYEAFEAVKMNQITYGFKAPLPAYSTGLKADYALKDQGIAIGASVTDSFFSQGTIAHKGDNNWGNGLAYTAAITYTGVEKLTLFAAYAYGDNHGWEDDKVVDLWASYAVDSNVTVGGEFSYYDGAGISFKSAIATAQYTFDEKISVLGRVSTNLVRGHHDLSFTVSPAYKYNEHLTLRAELTYITQDTMGFYSGYSPHSTVHGGYCFGVQALYKF